MAQILEHFTSRRRNRSSATYDNTSGLPDAKKSKQLASLSGQNHEQEDEIITALNMSQELHIRLQVILKKLRKLDTIESSLKNIELNLKSLEERTQKLETFQSTELKDINDLKESLDFTGKETRDEIEALKKSQQDYEHKLAELWRENENMIPKWKTFTLKIFPWNLIQGGRTSNL